MMNLIAPLSGRVLPLEAVPDPVFAQKLVGPGIAIDPTSTELKSPLEGTVVQFHNAHHALTIAHDSGLNVLIHVGIETVQLKGEGFVPKVKVGDRVRTGQILLEFDADTLALKAKSLISVIVITEPAVKNLISTAKTLVVAGTDELFAVDLGPGADVSPTTPLSSGRAESDEIPIHLPTGLHARPAAVLVSRAKSFRSEIQMAKNGRRGNAKSLVAVLALEVGNGDRVRFSAQGPDADQAVEDLAAFLEALKEKEPEPPVTTPQPSAAASVWTRQDNLLHGVAVSPGLAIGRVYQIRAQQFEFNENSAGTPVEENRRFNDGLTAAARELEELGEKVKSSLDASRAAIFSAHRELLEDPDILSEVRARLDQGKTAAFAWSTTIQIHAQRLAQLNNELLANRANDLRDVGQRVLRHLSVTGAETRDRIEGPTILVAENLTPSETVQLDRSKIVGFCTTTGGATSHVAILARSLGLPAIAGIEARALDIPSGTEVVLNGDQGELHLKPTVEEKQTAARLQAEQLERQRQALTEALAPAHTRDGHHVEVMANIGSVADARTAVEMGCDGVGLLRSEFLFLERESAPTEDEQYRVYQEIADVLGQRPLTIRTLDVGGDKPLKYLPLPPEENPFLGVRGIRIGLKHPEILRQQLRAILRVRGPGRINVMFPMIATLEEFRRAKQILEEERVRMNAPRIRVGIMVEVPSAALIAEALAEEADFFSIGTNDLTQYALAMDRGHTELAKEVDSLHPSVLKLIEMSVEAAHRHGKWVGVCGGLASDLKAVGILVGLGVDELSVSLPSIPLVKAQVRDIQMTEAKAIGRAAIRATNGDQVRDLHRRLHHSQEQGL
jgi:phosphoenolpyruvate-protein phosphotransferase